MESRITDKDVTLVIITRHDVTIQNYVKQMFLESEVAKRLGIKDIKFLQVGPGLWAYYISRSDIDIAWGGGPTIFDEILRLGYVAPLTSPAVLYEAQKIPDEISGVPMKRFDENGNLMWIAAAISSFGFTVNHAKLAEWGLPMPQKWRDLASIELASTLPTPAVGIADPTKSTSNTRMYEIILQAYGWEEGWKVLTIMSANSRIYDASDAVRLGVINGEIAVGITIDFYGYTAMQLNPDCEYIIPNGESIINGDPIALLTKSRHPEHAQAFIAWVLSEFGGQQIWLKEDVNRMPANPRVFDTEEGAKRPDLKERFEKTLDLASIPFNDTEALLWERAMQEYFSAVLVQAHSELQQAWTKIVDLYYSGQLTDDQLQYYISRLGEPLTFVDPSTGQTVKFTREYAISINEKLKTDPTFYNAIKSAWRDAAIARFNEILQELGG